MKGPFNRVKYDPRRTWECPTCLHRERSECEATFRICRRKLNGQTCNAWMKLIEEARPIRTRSIFSVPTFLSEPNSASMLEPLADVEKSVSEKSPSEKSPSSEKSGSEKSGSEQEVAESAEVEAVVTQDGSAAQLPSERASAASEVAPSPAPKDSTAPGENASDKAPAKSGGRRSRRRRRGRSK